MARSRKEHQEISSLLLGYSDARVHSLMDWHARFLGPGHRIAGHSLQMLDAIELLLGPEARKEALLHLLVDARIVRVAAPRQAGNTPSLGQMREELTRALKRHQSDISRTLEVEPKKEARRLLDAPHTTSRTAPTVPRQLCFPLVTSPSAGVNVEVLHETSLLQPRTFRKATSR